jgi:hypothetical protein
MVSIDKQAWRRGFQDAMTWMEKQPEADRAGGAESDEGWERKKMKVRKPRKLAEV